MNYRKIFTLAVLISALIATPYIPLEAQQAATARTRLQSGFGVHQASGFNTWYATINSGNSATGSSSITIRENGVTLASGGRFQPFSVTAPITIGSGATGETVTPTAVSNCAVNGPQFACTVTASFTYLHGPGERITSGSFGLQEALNVAFAEGGGAVTIDGSYQGTNATIVAAVPYGNVANLDMRTGVPQYTTPAPSTTTLQAAPTVLSGQAACDATHTFCSDANVAGSASWGSTVYGCITLVDIMGNESPCSSTISFTSVASKAIDIGAPTAVTNNIVGWRPYLSVSGGSYALAYSLPLLTQPTVLHVLPLSAGVCTLTTLETVTPACAIGNATYGQSASTTGAAGLFSGGGAQFTSYPVVTSQLAPEIGSASATAYNANEEAHATYAYAPGAHFSIGVQGSHFIFPITAAAQSTVGEVAGSFPVPADFLNYPGRTVEICGLIAKTSTTADTVDSIQVWWDAEGSNVTAGTPVEISSINITEATALAAAANFDFCQQISTTVAAATATGSTLQPGKGYANVSQVSAGANPSNGSSSLVAAVGSLNLALPGRLSVLLTHTTGTDGAGSKMYGGTLRVLN